MAAPLPFTLRRTAATVSSTTLKAPVRQTTATAFLQRRCLSAATRALGTSQRRVSPISTEFDSPKKQLQPQHGLGWTRSQVRRFSDESSPSFRSWGFEDINTSLPSDAPSPTHKPVVLVDVREPHELTATGIIPSALSIPLASQPDALYLTPDEFETRFGFPKPQVEGEHQLVFYCKAGVRARAAAQLAAQAGYDPDRIGVYEGSWLDWAKKGGKVEKWEGDDA